MDYFEDIYDDSFQVDPLDDGSVAAAVEGLDTPPAPTGFGYVVPSQGMEPRSLAASYVVDSSSAPPRGVQWHAASSYSTVYASASLPSSGASNLLQFSGPRMSLTRPQPSSLDSLLAQRAAVDQALAVLVSFPIFAYILVNGSIIDSLLP